MNIFTLPKVERRGLTGVMETILTILSLTSNRLMSHHNLYKNTACSTIELLTNMRACQKFFYLLRHAQGAAMPMKQSFWKADIGQP